MEPNGGLSAQNQAVLSLLKDEFNFQNGFIMDMNGRPWIMWHTTDLYAWWHSFEEQCQTPLGRKLMNACADQEEFFLHRQGTLSKGWWRRKKTQQEAIDARWSKYGWGSLSIEKETATSLLFAPMVGGLALAAHEAISQHRKKLQWNQVNSKMIRFDLSESSTVLPPAPEPPNLPWCSATTTGLIVPPVFEEMTVGECELYLDGESVCMFPVDAFTRLFHTCRAYQITVSLEQQEAWLTPQLTDGDRSVFLMVIASMSALVQQSERPIYLDGAESWTQQLHHYLGPFGWGLPVSAEAMDSPDGMRFTLQSSASLPFLVGWIVAMWERGHGKMSKFTLHREEESWTLDIESRLAYN